MDLFTKQLNESNPLLTKISNAMTMEGTTGERIMACHKGQGGGEEEKKEDGVIEKRRLVMERESLTKSHASKRLMECNMKYQRLMKELRES